MVFIEQSLPFRNFAVLGKLGSGSQRPGDTVDILARWREGANERNIHKWAPVA